jgi:hypothetical protein
MLIAATINITSTNIKIITLYLLRRVKLASLRINLLRELLFNKYQKEITINGKK